MQETEKIEFKAGLNENIEKEIVAFLNSFDGVIYIGINDEGRIVGISNVDKTMIEIADIITTRILPNPQNLINYSAKLVEDKIIIEIKIKKGSSLYYIKKYGRSAAGCFIRMGTTVRSMTEEQIEERYLKSLKITKLTIQELETPRKDLTFNEFKKILLIKNIYYNEESFELNFHLKNKNDEYNYIAYLLSDQNTTSIKVCRFKGFNKADFIPRKELEDGCILRKMEQAYEYTINVLNIVQTDVSGGKNRIDTPLFDNESFKEAWFNAVCHNLWIDKIPPAIYGFEDRLEIISHGVLRDDLSIEDFYKGVSKPVNEALADIFLKLHYMEQSGKGTSVIINKYGKEVYHFGKSYIECVLPYNIINKNKYEIMIGKQNASVNALVKMGKVEKVIYQEISKDDKITIDKLAKKLQKDRRTITRNIKLLKNKGILQRIGSDKNGYWQVSDCE